ncbi:helix-turn-helix domain-containing protein [Alienimonas sp. DA493]|uniref:helix-turn-helix domain-containing protein n=1 Tax=Alienimonas sp. DA493 TaxID=3373605 RepID=UPI0037542FC6
MPERPAVKNAAPAPVLLNTLQAADAHGLSERKLRDLTAPRGPITPVRLGRLIRYRPADLEAFASDHRVPAGASDSAR